MEPQGAHAVATPRAFDAPARRFDQAIDLGRRKRPRQQARPLRPGEGACGVFRDEALGGKELEQLADRRKAPRARGRRQPALRRRAQVGGNVGGRRGRERPAARGQEGEKVVEIAGVGLQRVVRRTPFGAQHLHEPADELAVLSVHGRTPDAQVDTGLR